MARFVLRKGFLVVPAPDGSGRVVHVRTEDALLISAEELGHLTQCAQGGLDEPQGEALAVAERFVTLGVLARPGGSAPSAADFYELSLEDAPAPRASPTPVVAPGAPPAAVSSPPLIPPTSRTSPLSASAPAAVSPPPIPPLSASAPVVVSPPPIPPLAASAPAAVSPPPIPPLAASAPAVVSPPPIPPLATVEAPLQALEAPPDARPSPHRPAADAAPVGPAVSVTPSTVAEVFAGTSPSGLLSSLEPLPAEAVTLEATAPSDPLVAQTAPAFAPVLGELDTAGAEPARAISPFEGSTPSTVLAALDAMPAAPEGGQTVVLNGSSPSDIAPAQDATTEALFASTPSAPYLAPPSPMELAPLPGPPLPPGSSPSQWEAQTQALQQLEPLRPPITSAAPPAPSQPPTRKAGRLAVGAVLVLVAGVGLTLGLRGERSGPDPRPAPPVTAPTGAPTVPSTPTPPVAEPPVAEPPVAEPATAEPPTAEADVDAGPALVAATPDVPTVPEGDGEWLEVKPAAKGRVTMGPLTAPGDGTLKWTVKAEQLVKKGQAVGQVAGEEGAGGAVTAPSVGLAVLKVAEGTSVSAGQELGSIIYFEAYARALVIDAQPTTSWRCEVSSAAAGQRSPCKVTAAAPKGAGVQVTATVEPRWFDDAADAVLRLAPP